MSKLDSSKEFEEVVEKVFLSLSRSKKAGGDWEINNKAEFAVILAAHEKATQERVREACNKMLDDLRNDIEVGNTRAIDDAYYKYVEPNRVEGDSNGQ